jgi:septin family protein
MKRKTPEQEEVKEQEPKSIMVVGTAGVGKSTFCSFFIDGRESQRFNSSNASVGGVTREMQIAISHALGDSSMPRVKVIDTAGFGDPTLSIKDLVKQFKKVFSS